MKIKFCTLLLLLFFSSSILAGDFSAEKIDHHCFTGRLPSDPTVQQLKQKIDSGKIGGIILFKRNISTKKQLKSLSLLLNKKRYRHFCCY